MTMSVALLFLPTLCLVAVAMPVPAAAAAATAAVAVSMPAATAMIIMVHGAIAGSRLVWLQRRLLLHCLFLPSTAMTVPMAPTSMTVSMAACSAHHDTPDKHYKTRLITAAALHTHLGAAPSLTQC